MSNNELYSTPPLGSRPPFATDDDHLYDEKGIEPTRRLKQPTPADPNARSSAYNMYDSYLDEGHRDSGVGALGMGMMEDLEDDEDDPFDDRHRSMQPPPSPRQQNPIPLAAPKPGYAAPVSALNINPPSPAASPVGRQPSPQIRPLVLVSNMNNPQSPRMPSPAGMVPATPHPLPPTITPIQPVFARPSKSADERDVKFASQPILRGEKEETLLPKRGEKGDDFWRRFSMVVKEQSATPQKESPWLRKTQNGTTRLTRWVWVIGILLLACVAGGIGIGMYVSSQSTTHNAPKAIGGSANEKLQGDSSSAEPAAGGGAASTAYHVSPTRTVARRDDAPVPTDVPLSFVNIPKQPSSFAHSPLVRAVPPSRHRRSHLNRTNNV